MSRKQNHKFHSPLRYPGGKGVLSNFMKMIVSHNNLWDGDYVELYAGGAGIAWSLLFEEYVQRVHINDLNKSLYAFWHSVLQTPEELCRLIIDTPVSMQERQRQQAIQQQPDQHTTLEVGFSTFFLNRTSRSGILDGGVIGGKEQNGTYKLDARYNAHDLALRIQRIARFSNRISLYNLDAAEFIRTQLPLIPQRSLIYLDPPYFHKGQDLYENHYRPADHADIAHLVLNNIEQPWVVSYDNTPEIVALYPDQVSMEYKIDYKANCRYAGAEVIFFSNNLTVPNVSNPIRLKLEGATRPLF